MTIQEFKAKAVCSLQKTSPYPQLDVQVLLEHALCYDKTKLLLKKDEQLSSEKQVWLEQAVQKRSEGLPVAYITGHKEFYGYDFFVTQDVLIPKPDTEILVERAVSIILEKLQSRPGKLLTVCDMCTGSGCIALSVIKTLLETKHVEPSALPKFTLADISEPALRVARKNAETLLLSKSVSQPGLALPETPSDLISSRLAFVRTNLFENIPGSFDVILSNPPYIPHTMVDDLLQDGRKEPRLALDGDITLNGERATNQSGRPKNDGLEIIRNLITQSRAHLAPLGAILMETGEYNAKKAAKLGEQSGYKTQIYKDLEGQLRVVEMNL